MTTSFRSETFDLSTDTHLADRARLGSAPAFEELVSRHAGHAVAMAMVITGDARAAVATGARAFTDVLDQMASGGYSIDDPYLPGLLRSARELALADATAEPALKERMDARLPELARSTRWLDRAAHLAAIDVALALDIDDLAIDGIIDWTDGLVAGHAEAVDAVLRDVHVLIPATFPTDCRAIWRTWLATAGVGGPTGLVDGPSRFSAIEPVAGRILRGAAVLLIVVGAAGAAVGVGRLGGSDSDGPRTISERAVAERPADSDGRSPDGSTPGSTGIGTGGTGGTAIGDSQTEVGPSGVFVTTGAAPGRTTGGALDGAAQGVALPSHGAGSGTAQSGSSASGSGPAGTPSTGSSPATSPGSSSAASPSAPSNPSSPSNPSGPAAPTTPAAPAAPKPPVKPSVPSTPATPAPAPTPTTTPATVPPVLAPIIDTVTGVVGGITGGLGLGR